MKKKLYPSAASRWTKCPGSVILCEQVPEELRSTTSPAAERGTAIHAAAAAAIIAGAAPKTVFANYGLDEDAQKEVQFYVDYVLSLVSERAVYGVEEQVVYESRNCVLSGIVDFYIYDGDVLRVVDLKTGAHEVQADNDQLKCYAIALLKKYEFEISRVMLVIVQRGEIREMEFKLHAIADFSLKLAEVAEDLEKTPVPFSPGPHCRWCPAAIICDEVHNAAVEAAKTEFSLINPSDVSARLYDVEDILIPYCNAVRDAAKRLMQTHEIPGWRLSPVRRRTWSSDCDSVRLAQWLAKRGVKSSELVKALTPAQVEKMLGDKLPSVYVDVVEVSMSVRKNDGHEFND